MIPLLRFLLDLIVAFAGPRTMLVAENLLLRQQVIVLRRRAARPRLRAFDRWFIGTLAGRFRRLLDAVIVVKPDTVIRWHRAGWRLLWRWQSRSRSPGRPPVDADLRALIRRMWRDNATWGENRIAGELAKLGYRVSPRTVGDISRGHAAVLRKAVGKSSLSRYAVFSRLFAAKRSFRPRLPSIVRFSRWDKSVYFCLTEHALKRGSHQSVPDLRRAILDYVAAHNEDGKRFQWTKTADEIFASIKRFCQRTGQVHAGASR